MNRKERKTDEKETNTHTHNGNEKKRKKVAPTVQNKMIIWQKVVRKPITKQQPTTAAKKKTNN